MNRALLLVPALLVFSSSHALEYEKDIMPFLAEKCGECHSKDGKAKGGLKLDDPEAFYARFSKNSIVVPGDWDASYLFVTLFRPADHDDAMPPKGKGTRLTPEETRKVQQWIADGASIAGEKGESGPMPKEGEAGFIAVAVADSGDSMEKEEEAQPAAVEQDWTNTEGKTIRATLLRVDGDVALLKMKNGQVYKYPISKLSAKSKEQLPK